MCFDIARSTYDSFDYSAIEALKNGFLITGKYDGRQLRFHPVPVVVFANMMPDTQKLSRDRWDILTIGSGLLQNSSATYASQDVKLMIAPSPPTPSPKLFEDFDLKTYLKEKNHLHFEGNTSTTTCTLHGDSGKLLP